MLLKLEKGINRLMDWIGITAAILLILLVIIVTFNVFNRYWIQIDGLGVGGEEVAWHIYATVFMFGIPYALRTGSHVRVDLIFENLKPKTKALVDIAGSILFLLPFCVVVIWSGSVFVIEAWQLGSHPDAFSGLIRQIVTTGVGEQSQDPGGLLNRWIIKAVIPVTFILLLLAAFSFFLNKLNVLMSLDKEQDSSMHGQGYVDAGKKNAESIAKGENQS